MSWTGADIIQQVRDRASLQANSSEMTDTVLLRMVNQALFQVSLEADWPWLRTSGTPSTVAGTATLTPPAGWVRTLDLFLSDVGQPLSRRHLKEVRRNTGTGRPYCYAVTGGLITLSPTPDAAYALIHDYVQQEPKLAATTDTPLIPEVYGQGVVEWAAYKAFQRQQQPDKASTAAADYKAWLLRTRDNINQGREPLRITVRPGAWF